MVNICSICQWHEGKEPRRSLYKFPVDANINDKLLDILDKCGVVPEDEHFICSLHFEDHCFNYNLISGVQCLRKCSLPTLHLSSPLLSQLGTSTSKSSIDKNNLCDQQCNVSTSTVEKCISDGVTTKRTSDAINKTAQNSNKRVCLDKSPTKSFNSTNCNSTKPKRLLITIYKKIR